MAGMLTGFISGSVANPRGGLSAHLQGVMNGTFLLAVGSTWPHVRLSSASDRAALWLLAYGTWINWIATLLAAILNTGVFSPVTAPHPTAAKWQDQAVGALFVSVGVTMVAGVGLVIRGLLAARPAAK